MSAGIQRLALLLLFVMLQPCDPVKEVSCICSVHVYMCARCALRMAWKSQIVNFESVMFGESTGLPLALPMAFDNGRRIQPDIGGGAPVQLPSSGYCIYDQFERASWG